LASVELASHSEAGTGRGGRDQLDNHPIADEGWARQFWLMKEKSRCWRVAQGNLTPTRS